MMCENTRNMIQVHQKNSKVALQNGKCLFMYLPQRFVTRAGSTLRRSRVPRFKRWACTVFLTWSDGPFGLHDIVSWQIMKFRVLPNTVRRTLPILESMQSLHCHSKGPSNDNDCLCFCVLSAVYDIMSLTRMHAFLRPGRYLIQVVSPSHSLILCARRAVHSACFERFRNASCNGSGSRSVSVVPIGA